MHPSVEGDVGFIALTQPGTNIKEHPIAFLARYLTKIELKYSILTILVSVTAWVIRKQCYYTIFAVEVCIILPTIVDV